MFISRATEPILGIFVLIWMHFYVEYNYSKENLSFNFLFFKLDNLGPSSAFNIRIARANQVLEHECWLCVDSVTITRELINTSSHIPFICWKWWYKFWWVIFLQAKCWVQWCVKCVANFSCLLQNYKFIYVLPFSIFLVMRETKTTHRP